jgi:hypothetical protein
MRKSRSKEPFRESTAGRRLRPATVCLLQHIQVPSGRKIYKSVLRVRLFFHPPSAIDITYERSFEFGAKKREWAQIGSLGLAVQPLRLFSLRAPQRIRVLSDRTLQNRIKRKRCVETPKLPTYLPTVITPTIINHMIWVHRRAAPSSDEKTKQGERESLSEKSPRHCARHFLLLFLIQKSRPFSVRSNSPVYSAASVSSSSSSFSTRPKAHEH